MEDRKSRRLRQLARLLAKWDRPQAPGIAVMLIREGRVEYSTTLGLANIAAGEPIRPDTQFRLCSLSKAFTAMAIMILAEEGALCIDDWLSTFCPEFPGYARHITLRHLLQHTSGLPDYEALLFGRIDANFFSPSGSQPSRHEATAHDALRLLSRQQSLRFPPGARFEYSNSGYVVLGQVIERVSGIRYAEFLHDRIFEPLSLRHTLVIDERKQEAPRLALAYAPRRGAWCDITYSPANWIYGEDNVFSSLDDLHRWDQALSSHQSTHAFGWIAGAVQGHQTMEHSGSWSGYRNRIIRVPGRNVTAVVLSNAAPSRSAKLFWTHRAVDTLAGRMVEIGLE